MTSIKQIERLELQANLEKCFRLQRKLAAVSYVKERLSDLYNLSYSESMVDTAIKIVRSRKGAKTPGVDGVHKKNVDHKALKAEVIQELRNESIQPQPLRKVDVPKANGKIRTLSIPIYKDRVVLTIIKLILEPIYEPHFDASSYGFRPNMSCHDAIGEIKWYLGPKCNYAWVIESDVKACFDSIPKGRLLGILEERIADGRLIQLIRKYLYAGMAMEGFPSEEELAEWETDESEQSKVGCPQGSPLSPLLCNIYLSKLDEFVNKEIQRIQEARDKESSKPLDNKPASIRRRKSYQGHKQREARIGPFHLIRYADDLVIVSPASKENVERYWQEVKLFAKQRLGIQFAEEKSRIIHATDGFSFLGFHLKRIYRKDINNRVVFTTVDPKRREKHKEAIRKLLKGGFDRDTGNVIMALNLRIRGYRNYFQKSVTDCSALSYVDMTIFWLLIKWLMKKYKAPISKVFKCFYGRARNKKGRNPLTIVYGGVYLEKATLAIPKHIFDYTRKPCHPWIKRQDAQGMIESCFPQNSNRLDWTGRSSYGESYAKMMRKALKRDRYECCKCGNKEDLHVHHLNKRKSYNNPKSKEANSLENLATLCSKCHKFAEKLSAIDCINWLLLG